MVWAYGTKSPGDEDSNTLFGVILESYTTGQIAHLVYAGPREPIYVVPRKVYEESIDAWFRGETEGRSKNKAFSELYDTDPIEFKPVDEEESGGAHIVKWMYKSSHNYLGVEWVEEGEGPVINVIAKRKSSGELQTREHGDLPIIDSEELVSYMQEGVQYHCMLQICVDGSAYDSRVYFPLETFRPLLSHKLVTVGAIYVEPRFVLHDGGPEFVELEDIAIRADVVYPLGGVNRIDDLFAAAESLAVEEAESMAADLLPMTEPVNPWLMKEVQDLVKLPLPTPTRVHVVPTPVNDPELVSAIAVIETKLGMQRGDFEPVIALFSRFRQN